MATELDHLLQAAERSHKIALDSESSGNTQRAQRAFLDTADYLVKAAALSSNILRQSRLDVAEHLLSHAAGLGREISSGREYPKNSPVQVKGDENSKDSWIVNERPQTKFTDVAGLDDVKEQIRLKLLYPYSYPEEATRYGIAPGGGILLYGPPGTGKTLIARAVAGEIEAAFFAIKPSQIMSEWVGVAEKNVARLFEETGNYALSVVFIDEIEALTPKRRSSGSTVMVRVVPQILAELDGFKKRSNPMLFIGATNEPWAIDAAILRPGRLDRLIYVPPPDQLARHQILSINLQGAPLAPEVDLLQIAACTERFSGADMAALTRQVREKVFIEAIQQGIQRLITQQDFEAILAHMRPSITLDDLRIYERFASTGSK